MQFEWNRVWLSSGSRSDGCWSDVVLVVGGLPLIGLVLIGVVLIGVVWVLLFGWLLWLFYEDGVCLGTIWYGYRHTHTRL